MTGTAIAADEDVFLLHPDNVQYWDIADDLRTDLTPATVINYIGRIVAPDDFRQTYRAFMEFAESATAAVRSKQ